MEQILPLSGSNQLLLDQTCKVNNINESLNWCESCRKSERICLTHDLEKDEPTVTIHILL